MPNDTFFQFPLCALAYGQAVTARLDAIIDYAVVEAGSSSLAKRSAEHQYQFLQFSLQAEGVPRDFKEYLPQHRAALIGAEIIGVKYSCMASVMDRWQAINRHITDFERRYGRDAKVRIKKDWLFATRDGKGISYREFSVLCAIYSVIGQKDLAIVTRENIRRRALGYRTAAIMKAELRTRADKGQPLTERQLRDTIARLHENLFFARCTVARRITYYSIRLKEEELRQQILARRSYSAYFHARQSALDKTLTAALRKKRHEAARSGGQLPPPPPRSNPNPPSSNG